MCVRQYSKHFSSLNVSFRPCRYSELHYLTTINREGAQALNSYINCPKSGSSQNCVAQPQAPCTHLPGGESLVSEGLNGGPQTFFPEVIRISFGLSSSLVSIWSLLPQLIYK